MGIGSLQEAAVVGLGKNGPAGLSAGRTGRLQAVLHARLRRAMFRGAGTRCLVPIRKAVGAWALAGLVCFAAPSHGMEDLPGARDPEGIPRFPRAWVVFFEEEGDFQPREFVVSAVEKIRRELRIDQKLRVEATALRVTYRVPAGTPRADVVGYYRRLLGADSLFSCEGRDCGRSNGWANLVFRQAVLYGPDGNQFYIAADRDGQLVSVYVIERGNRRIYAHVEVLDPKGTVSASVNAKLTERLAGDGFSVIGGVRPRRDGTIPAEGVQMLRDIAPQLRIFERQSLYVVCHLYGPEAGGVLLERAGACARAAAEELERGVAAAGGPELIPFGAGPLLPRTDGAASRIELVLPHRQQRD